MYPELFRIGPLTIHTFGATLAVTFLLIAWLGGRDSIVLKDIKINVPIDNAKFGRPAPLKPR